MHRMLSAVLVTLLIAGAVVGAHHSYSSYDTRPEAEITIDGVLEEFHYVNPHSLLVVRSGGTLYTGEWLAINGLKRSSIEAGALKIGDHVIMIGNPHRQIVANGLLNVRAVRRPSDGWTWEAGRRGTSAR